MDMESPAGEPAPATPESRTAAFGSGMAASAEKFMAAVPPGFAQHSVLQQQMPSDNGMAKADYERILPGVNNGGRPLILPSQNGTSNNTWEQAMYMRLNGRNVI